VRAAVLGNSIGRDALAWHEGLPAWQPVSQLAAELGLEAAATPPPPPPRSADGTAAAHDPYQPPGAGLVFRDGHAGEVVQAGFVRRWAALFIDQLILSIPLVLALFAVFATIGIDANPEPSAAEAVALLLVYPLYFLCAALYCGLQESSTAQATLGKRALGIKVVDMEGRRIGRGQAFGRWFAAALSYISLYIGFLMAAFTERKQALHDFVAGTQVVDQWAYTPHPERQKRGLNGCLVAFLVAMLFVPIIAILAAISISQYQDYVIRSQVSEGSSLADGVKTAVAEYVENRGGFPPSNADAGLAEAASITGAYVASVDVGQYPGHIVVTYSAQSPQAANAAIDGHRLHFIGQGGAGSITWVCASDELMQKWCPSSCECTGRSGDRQ
jgi:uncharacterized RDD family membrane protein YckC/Tfp pilus assembly major pilin PilA